MNGTCPITRVQNTFGVSDSCEDFASLLLEVDIESHASPFPRLLSLVPSQRYTIFHLATSAMSNEAARRAPMMPLQDLVTRYLSLAGGFGKPVALSGFQLPAAETELLFSSYDEDYHISRFFHFSEDEGEKFSINGIAATHVSVDPEIESIL